MAILAGRANYALLLQPYLSSVESEGELGVIFIDGQFSHAVRKIPVVGDYRVQDDFGASDEAVQLTGDELGLAQRVVQSFPCPACLT